MTTSQEVRHYVRSALGRRRFNLLIFFVTSRCNAKCDFCFYWDHLNQQGDLTMEEIRKISATMNAPIIFDGRNCLLRDVMRENGFQYYPMGRPAVENSLRLKRV